jgi:predicted NodU family carbamoyl transferase
MQQGLIIGLNKYSHDAGCCIVDSTGKILFAQAKERITRHKHDAGSVTDICMYGLESIGAAPGDVKVVVSNNHHFRVLPYERQFKWYKVSLCLHVLSCIGWLSRLNQWVHDVVCEKM